jgi:hypothetical protein
MAVTTKKGSKSTQAKSRRTVVKKSRLRTKQDRSLQSQLAEALEQQAATSEILRMIASSPAELQSTLDVIAKIAARLCDATDAAVWRVDGDVRRVSAHFGSLPMQQFQEDGDELGRSTTVGRAVIDRQTIHVHDLQAAEAEFLLSKTRGIASGVRTVLVTPLVKTEGQSERFTSADASFVRSQIAKLSYSRFSPRQ